ncbi:MAG: hypothetical protein ABIH65_03750 [Nanoarchaeota archaeon]
MGAGCVATNGTLDWDENLYNVQIAKEWVGIKIKKVRKNESETIV